jgi:ABC-2 type transport system permease protein
MSLRKFFTDVAYISLIYSKWLKRYPIHYFSVPVLLPLGTLFAFAFTIAPQNRLYAVSGSIVFSITVNTLLYIAQWVGSDRQIRRLSLFATLPVSPIAYGFGVALSVTFRGVISIATILVFATWLFGLTVTWSWLALIPTLLVSFAAGVLIGLLIAWLTKDPRALFSIAQFFTFTLGLFSPVYYSIDVLPYPLRVVASAIPTTYSGELTRDSLSGNMSSYLSDLWPLLVIVGVLTVLVKLRTKWRQE